MTDPYEALVSFKQALAAGAIFPQSCEIHKDVLLLSDAPNGTSRLTYALKKKGNIVALVTCVASDPLDGAACFNIGYAVDIDKRSSGYGKEVVQKAFDELVNGFRRANVPHLYVEAVVSISNEHSNKLALRVISSDRKEITDFVSGKPAFHYTRKLY